jgi:signal transduction histidine kinase
MRRTRRLTPKVTLVFVIFAALLLLSVGVLAYTSGRTALEAATLSGLQATAIEKQAAFDAWVDDALSRISVLAESSLIQERLDFMLRSEDESDLQAAHDRLVAELDLSTGQGSRFLRLLVLHPDSGRIIAATEPNEEGHFKEDRPYFVQGREGPYIQNVYYSLELQGPAMTVSAPVRRDGGELIGVLAGRLDLAAMGEIINRHTEEQRTGDAYLVNLSHLFVTQPRFMTDSVILRQGIYTEHVNQCLDQKNGTILANDYRGLPVIAAFQWLAERELCLIVKIDQAEAFAPIEAFGSSLVLTGVAALLVSAVLAVGLARTITRPILALQAGVIRFGKGELDIRFPETTGDEIGSLAHEFNAMAQAIAEKETLLQNYAQELEGRVAERTYKLAFLAEASAVLSESLDYSTRLKQLAQLAVPRFADWCSIDILEGNGLLTRLAVVHTDPAKVEYAYELQSRYPPDPNASRGAYNVVRTGQSEMVAEITDELLVASAMDEEQLTIVRALGLKSAMSVPLMAHGRALGVMGLVMAESGRHYNADDLALAGDLARRAALLIDNARLFQQAQQLNAELERRVAERTAQLESTNRELEAFSYSVSHDLRAPLRALDGFSQALQADYGQVLDEDGQDFLNRIRAGSQRMGQLIDDLISLSRLTRAEMHFKPVDLSELVRNIVVEMRESQPGRSVDIVIQNTPVVQGDESLLRAMLHNLLSNAWKFTSKKPDTRIEFGVNYPNGMPVYYVRDNGAGFNMDYADKLFGAFQRLHRTTEFEGNGIGLATVQRIVHRHGGRIWAEGVVNQGATFSFSFQHEV